MTRFYIGAMKNFNECFLEYAKLARGQLISKCLQFPTKNELKQVKLRFHCSKVEFVRSFFRETSA